MISDIVQKIKKSPKEPGIYIFYSGKEALYVGKASNLRNRLKSYLKITDIKTKSLHEEATSLKMVVLRSNIEALIVESKMIKGLRPKYNVLFRDDKNYFYVCFSDDKFPRVYITHQPDIVERQPRHQQSAQTYAPPVRRNAQRSVWCGGPFTDGASLKSILRLIRRTIPYCTHKPHLRLCLDAQINNCLGYCCKTDPKLQIMSESTNNKTKENIRKYGRNITRIKNILTGEDWKFIKSLKDPYELLILEKIWAHRPYLDKGRANSQKGKDKSNILQPIGSDLLSYKKIECYDNSHLSGKEAVGAMTAWRRQANSELITNNGYQIGSWSADKNMWRKFKIIGNYTEDDPRMMEEMISRRLNHPEWTYPDLMIIDGGITQFNAAKRALAKTLRPTAYDLRPKLISFAKPNQEVYGLRPLPVPISELPEDFQRIIRMAIQNTHNFVLRYHRSVRRREFLPKD